MFLPLIALNNSSLINVFESAFIVISVPLGALYNFVNTSEFTSSLLYINVVSVPSLISIVELKSNFSVSFPPSLLYAVELFDVAIIALVNE